MSRPRVFISYSRESHSDVEWVRAFADALQQQQVEVWLDEWKIRAGESFSEAIETGLRQSDAIVAVLSPATARNPSVFFELRVALGTGKRLMPIVSTDLGASMIPCDLRTRRVLRKG